MYRIFFIVISARTISLGFCRAASGGVYLWAASPKPHLSFPRKRDKIAGSDFKQPKAGTKGAEYRDVFRNPALDMVSRAWRAISIANCGWLRPCALGSLDSDPPLSSPGRQASPVQIRSRRICLGSCKDNFAGSKIGRALRARRVRATDGAGPKETKRKHAPERANASSVPRPTGRSNTGLA